MDATPDWLKAFNNSLSSAFQTAFQGQGGAAPYSGPQFADASSAEQGVLGQIQGGLGGTEQSRQKFLTDATSGAYLPGGAQQNPFLQSSIADAQRTTNQGLSDALTKSLPGKFTQAGHFLSTGSDASGGGGSSPFDAAAATAFRGAADANASIATNMSNNAWNSGQQQQTAAAQISQQEVQAATAKLTALGLPREIQGSNVNLALQTWQTQLQGFLTALGAATGVGNNVKIGTDSKSEQTAGIVPGVTNAFSAAFPKGV